MGRSTFLPAHDYDATDVEAIDHRPVGAHGPHRAAESLRRTRPADILAPAPLLANAEQRQQRLYAQRHCSHP
ncbi:MAG TPA: hypothetical protein VHE80_01880 [Acidimicrobiales bacterium]|nr:hypothetical protein [Acidimicrobiales bacterium]